MRPGPLLHTYILFCVLAIPVASAQEVSSQQHIQSILRLASSLIPLADQNQQATIASQIANRQARVEDLAGALKTIARLQNDRDRAQATGGIAPVLAWQGDLPAALSLVRGPGPIDSANATLAYTRQQQYSSIAAVLAGKKQFEEALRIAELIKEGPVSLSRSNLFVNTLMRIYAKQVQAGDSEGAQTTVDLALQAVDHEIHNPSAPEFSESGPAGMYGTIASELVREGNRVAALQVLERIYGLVASASDPKHRQDTLFQLAYSQAAIGEVASAESTIRELNPGQQRQGVEMMIALQRTKQGDPLAVIDDVMAFSYEPLKDISLSVIATTLWKSGNYVRAISTLERIAGIGERADAMAKLALEQAEEGDSTAPLTAELACDLVAKGGHDVKPYVLEEIAATREFLGDYASALETISKLSDVDKVWPLRTLMGIWVKGGKESDALQLADSEPPSVRIHLLLEIAVQAIENENQKIEAR